MILISHRQPGDTNKLTGFIGDFDFPDLGGFADVEGGGRGGD